LDVLSINKKSVKICLKINTLKYTNITKSNMEVRKLVLDSSVHCKCGAQTTEY
jgi:hypothetical protein